MALLVGLEVEEIKQLLAPDHPGYRARQLYRALYHDRLGDLDEVTTLPADLRRKLAASPVGGGAKNGPRDGGRGVEHRKEGGGRAAAEPGQRDQGDAHSGGSGRRRPVA